MLPVYVLISPMRYGVIVPLETPMLLTKAILAAALGPRKNVAGTDQKIGCAAYTRTAAAVRRPIETLNDRLWVVRSVSAMAAPMAHRTKCHFRSLRRSELRAMTITPTAPIAFGMAEYRLI